MIPPGFEQLKCIANIAGQSCFGCGQNNAIGLRMHFKTDDSKVYSRVAVPAAMAGWDATVHGGIISTMLDEIMGWSVIYLLGKIGVTKTMTVTFMKPISVEEELTVIGSVQQVQTGRQVLVTGEIYNAGNVLCAKASGEFASMTPQAAVRLGVMSPAYMERFVPILEQSPGRKI